MIGAVRLVPGLMIGLGLFVLQGRAVAETSAFIDDSEVDLSFRYRFEHVDDDAFSEEAEASTVRSRLTLTSGKVADWQVVAEVDDIREIIWDDFNAGAGNTPSRTQYPTVADPEGTELNQAFVRYSGLTDTTVTLGRQRINLDNQRFVGGVGWRQNEQTYDALRVDFANEHVDVMYAYVDNVNRIFGEDVDAGDHRQDGTHLLNLGKEIDGLGRLSGYYYGIDNEDAPLFSTRTVGIRLQGKTANEDLSIRYAAEYARQQDAANNPSSYDTDYVRADLGVVRGGLDVGVGFEKLGAESGGRFVTPLATLHAFNGWADKFLIGGSGNPGGGLEDVFVSGKLSFGDGYTALARWHDFEADVGGNDLGSEINVSLSRGFGKHLKGALFAADFNGDSGLSDTFKFWLMLTVTL